MIEVFEAVRRHEQILKEEQVGMFVRRDAIAIQ